MWRNYVTVGVRALMKNRTYAFINIFGLAIGLAACLLILLYVRDQTSYDSFVADGDRVFQLQSALSDTETGAVDHVQMSPYPAGAALVKSFPQVESYAYFTNSQPIVMDHGQPRQLSISLASPDFFTIFRVPLLHGDAATALRDPNSVAISDATAQKLFRTDNPIGRTITYLTKTGSRDLRVSAVYKQLPKTSHQAFGMVRALDPQADLDPWTRDNWGNYSGYVYVKLRDAAGAAAINAGLDAWKERSAPKNLVGGRMVSQTAQVGYVLTPLRDIHLGLHRGGPAGNEGDRATVYTFAVLALLILVMACVNFTNLATARASQRAREVSLRKVMGATRGQLIAQFLTESVIVAGIATLLALAVVELTLPWLRDFLDAELAMRYLGTDGILLPAILLALAVGLAGGLYPAFYLTRFRPSEVLKANKSAADAQGSGRLRNALVVAQFAVSIGLIICTAVVYAQVQYARSADPGFRRAGLLQLENFDRSQVQPMAEALAREIARVPGVSSVARTSIGVDTSNRSNNNVLLPGRPTPLVLGTYSVGWNWPETMGMKLLAGRTLSEAHANDDATLPNEQDNAAEQALVRRGVNVVVNESSARQMGFRSPAEAIGKVVGVSLVSYENGTVPATIVGVVGDTRFRSAREEVEDMILYRNANWLPWLEVRFDDPDPIAVRARIEAVWKRMVPQVPFEADFADEKAARLYRSDVAMGQIFAAFAGLAVIVGCLGLFGLAAFTAERRTKEIGIRKVLGARTRDIVRLLVWQFSRPVLVANLIAWPIAFYAMRKWLNGFDTRVALGPTPFVAAALLALLIAVLTIASHAVKVARANPIKALRYE